MRFVHKKIPKSLAILHILFAALHILFAALHRRLEFDLPDRHLVSRLKLSGDYKKPANLRHYLHEQMHDRSRGPVDPAAMRKG
jgi:hypothetical protein